MAAVMYEVTATPQPQVREAYESYMRKKHIPDVLAAGCFVAARFAVTESGVYRITYVAASQADLDRYMANHTQRLREDFLAHFPDSVTLSREVWTVVEDWSYA